MFIEKLRQYVFLLSFLGACLLTLRFKLKGAIASILIEIVKYYFLGYHLLAESIVIYPIMLITGLLIESFSNNISDDLLFGISIFLTFFTLLPTWPFCFFAVLFYFAKKNFRKESIFLTTFPIVVLFIFIFLKINFFSWFNETILNNVKYFLPFETGLSTLDYFKISVYPFISFLNLENPIGRFSALMLTSSIICIVVIKKNVKQIFVFYFLLILLNLRVTNFNIGQFTAFHVLPHTAFLTVASVFLINFALKQSQNKIIQTSLITLLLVSFLSTSLWWKESTTTDKFNEHFIYYGNDESIGLALYAIKMPGDKLLAGHQEGFINVFSEIPLSTRQTSYLPWAFRSEKLKGEFENTIKNSPPTFIYFPVSENPYFLYLKPVLKEKYVRIKRTFGDDTDLYMLSSKVEERSKEQWDKFKQLLYQPPS